MRESNKDNTNLIFVILGSITGGIIKLAYDLGLFHNTMFPSAHNGRFDPVYYSNPIPYKIFASFVTESKYDPSQFFIGFGAIAFVLGIFYSGKTSYLKNKILNFILITSAFTLCGFAYSLWLHFFVSLDGFDVETIPFYSILVSFAVGIFVFIFCASFLSMPDNSEALVYSTAFSSLVIIFIVGTMSFGYAFSTATAIGLVSYLMVLVLSYLTLGYHYDEYFGNLSISLLAFTCFFSALPAIFTMVIGLGTVVFLLILIINLYYLFRVIDHQRKITGKPEVKFEKRFSHTIEWILSFPSVLLNCTVYGSIFSVIPYTSIVQFLQDSHQLSKVNLKRSKVLGFWAFIVYLSFFSFYSIISPSLSNSRPELFILIDVILWVIMGFVASKSLSYCLFELK